MIRRPFVLSAAALTLLLSACDGGGDDPAPTPSPSPSPSPSPTASPTYSAFPVAAATEFFAASATTTYTGDFGAGTAVLGAAGTDVRSDRTRLAISNVLSTGTWVVREASEESRFVTANNTVPPATGVTEFVFRTDDTATAGKFSQAEFLNNTYPATVTTDTGLNLGRVSYSSWWRGDSTAGQKRFSYFTWGYATAFSDVPTTGTATYTARVVGRRVLTSGITRLGGTATFTVNFATGLVNATLDVTVIGAGGAETPLGTFTGAGAIPVGTNQFNGSFSGASPAGGTYVGGFYGSQGAEIGVNFALVGTILGTDTRAVGAVVGRKN